MNFHIQISDGLKTIFDISSVSVTVASLLALLPHIASALAVVWWLYRIYGQWLENKKLKQEIERAD
jgi:hypothetical protein